MGSGRQIRSGDDALDAPPAVRARARRARCPLAVDMGAGAWRWMAVLAHPPLAFDPLALDPIPGVHDPQLRQAGDSPPAGQPPGLGRDHLTRPPRPGLDCQRKDGVVGH